MTAPRLYLDVHVLQSVPPSNINRDDSGTPKQAVFGGARRARVSSQAWKRATRTHFASSIPETDRATRTKKITELLATRLKATTGLAAEQADRLATALVAPLGIKKSAKKDAQSAYLLFFGKPQLDTVINLLDGRAPDLAALSDTELEAEIKKLPVAEQLTTGHPAEVALFGRMVADLPSLNVDAAVQVAHALSTHPVQTEFDYYTAVDDENTEDSGAGMIGTVEFNSSTLYRYATLGIHQLHDNLADAETTADTAARFLESFARSIPSGHQNSFAHRTLPHLVLVTLRTDQPVNLVSAYERPVRARDGIAEESVSRLAEELASVSETWGSAPALTLATYAPLSTVQDKATTAFGPSIPFPRLTGQVRTTLASWLETGELR
ncbi:type I-E CRISPR-associated protein Cas7/Cse4/CasC [Streptomyces sp. NBC_00237]|uniref:type I-E CRISPR-associated protein Cas7/Cse4/CasC n=1 Tax=Streptomyces sp. NBC_00237 TaxID=2975687 RepID=UPI0022561905|nr:type I-E CRISPR-associated protein Cas7/Cse4/CasC [Streptomyces sp. NBC_00237]MCX5206047.1 type I-E CRISPR-associated protein Cas7/Cse4/CasC [Streptomyces sp. NBC_00237]